MPKPKPATDSIIYTCKPKPKPKIQKIQKLQKRMFSTQKREIKFAVYQIAVYQIAVYKFTEICEPKTKYFSAKFCNFTFSLFSPSITSPMY